MEEDVYDGEDDDSEFQTQSTQATQLNSQPPPTPNTDHHLWGYLQPCNAAVARMDFWKIHPEYKIGRNSTNTIVFPGLKISNHHCTVTWDGNESNGSTVIVRDYSSNGTYINGKKVGKGQSSILREGNEIAFGTSVPQAKSTEDYRFIYRHIAGGPPSDGLYAYYDIGTELGKGSFATVMKAMCRRTGEWYAVKMIHERASRNGTHQRKGNSNNTVFAREISIMEKLRHPNICQLKEVFFQANNEINLVLELVEGGDLLEYILKNNGLGEVDAQHITYQVCQALAYIHSKGVAHRDLKPENILLTDHRPPIVKVADFGLAKAVDSMTMLRTMCGTPSYLAPEVVKQQNEEGYDNLVDSWSVGVIVFSMLTNAAPFIEDENQPDIRTRIAERRVDWSILRNADVSERAEDFIRCLLQDNPHYRMSLAEAKNHPWLATYIPPITIGSGDQSETPAFGRYPFETSTDEIPGMIYSANRQGSRLQRRSQVVALAEEENIEMLQPNAEMIANAEAYENASTAELYKGPGKRVYSELTPVSEDDDGMGSIGKAAGKASKGKGREPSPGEDASSGSRPPNKQARRT
ncbi:kinase-like domain-containing protein [Cyathus striatus]|nr:kinase-like domain-containing protein [Cyathus striatus]